MIINVTQKHIDEGQPGDACGCALALALREHTGLIWYVGTTETDAYAWQETDSIIPGDGPVKNVKLPSNLVKFVDDYDNRKTTYPFSFELEEK